MFEVVVPSQTTGGSEHVWAVVGRMNYRIGAGTPFEDEDANVDKVLV